jgi:homoserine kinase
LLPTTTTTATTIITANQAYLSKLSDTLKVVSMSMKVEYPEGRGLGEEGGPISPLR